MWLNKNYELKVVIPFSLLRVNWLKSSWDLLIQVMKLINFVIISRIIVRMDDWFLIFECCPHDISTIYRKDGNLKLWITLENEKIIFENFKDIKNAE